MAKSAARPAGNPTEAEAAGVGFAASPDFRSWLAVTGISIAFTAPRVSKLFMVGPGTEGEGIAVAERTVEGCQGVASSGRSLYVSSRWQVWRFENACPPGTRAEGYDAVYVPKSSHVTGDVDCHDMAVDSDGRMVFANTLFNCLAYLSRDYSFHPVWQPPFVSGLVAEDRCHLSGVALADGRPAFVTVAAETDTRNAWQESQAGGIAMDIRTNRVVCKGLSLPHAPRLHGRTLWLQNSGTGYLGRVDADRGTFEPVTFCPGYLRGMATVGNVAVCAVSQTHDGLDLYGLKLADNLKAAKTEPRCGLVVVDLTSGNILHWLRIEGMVTELFGVALLPGVLRPRAVGFKSDEISRIISLPPEAE